MRRNSSILFLESPGAVTRVPWINSAPDFTGFTDPTLPVLQRAWQEFLESGEQLEIISNPEPPQVSADIVGFFNQFTSPNSPGKPIYDSLASRALSIGGVTMLHFSNLQLLLLNPLTTGAMVVEGYNHLINLFDQNGQPLTAEENQALKDLAANYGINL